MFGEFIKYLPWKLCLLHLHFINKTIKLTLISTSPKKKKYSNEQTPRWAGCYIQKIEVKVLNAFSFNEMNDWIMINVNSYNNIL